MTVIERKPAAMTRAYSILTIKAVDEDARVITGIATTPSPDRMGDIVDPLGVKFKNPLPFLWQHRHDQPIGDVKFDKPTKDGITFTATVAKTDEPGALKDRLDEAWQSLKLRLVKAFSIGFRPLEYSYMDDGGVRFVSCEVIELSAVTIPANADCTLTTIRSIDAPLLAATGRAQPAGDRRDPPRDGGLPAVKAITPPSSGKDTKMPTPIAEQITAFEATRQAKSGRMAELMNKAADEGVTLDTEESTEYDTLESEVKSVDKHLERLKTAQTLNLQSLTPVGGASPDLGVRERDITAPGLTPRVQVRQPEVAKGIGFTRFVLALARAQGNIMMAEQMAKANDRWRAETPDVEIVLRAAVAAGSTTDPNFASALVPYQNLASEFIEFLRPQTIIGRLNLRNVPFKVKLPRQTGGASVGWVGEGRVKPVSSLAFDSLTLEIAKIAGIVVLTDELVRLSTPSAEGLVRDDLAAAIIQFMDAQFVDPSKAPNDVSPASITYGVTPVQATGSDLEALKTDVHTLMTTFVDSNLGIADAAWLMTQQQALGIGMMRNALGNKEYPDINVNGGTFEGLPVIASENLPGTGGSPADGFPLILVKQRDILLADDGEVTIDASREASLQMESTPDSPATGTTTLVSLWQHNMVGLRAERMVNWAKRRSESVGFIQNAKYRP